MDITVGGVTYEDVPLRRAMWLVASAAIEAGIHPRDLKFHEGTSYAGNRWYERSGEADARTIRRELEGLGKDVSRWFCDDGQPLYFAGCTWVLTNQWSWDSPNGSSRADLEETLRRFPQLGLSWKR
jgi:hypothetical protein